MSIALLSVRFFFFQAEDGIRDVAVTGVQTCALPIFVAIEIHAPERLVHPVEPIEHDPRPVWRERRIALAHKFVWGQLHDVAAVAVHEGDAAEGGFGPVNLEDDLPTVR